MGSTPLSQVKPMDSRGWRNDPTLAQILSGIAAATHRRFPKLGRGELAMTLVIPDGEEPKGASLRGKEPWYPASVVKLFYMVAVEAWLERGRLSPSRDLRGALHEMIARSDNDATNHIVDLLTGTTSGPIMAPPAFKTWLARRRAVNRFFAAWRYPEFAGINMTQKTWSFGPYGREYESRFRVPGNHNALSTDAVARLLLAVRDGAAVNRRRSAAMMTLLSRQILVKPDPKNPADQVFGFLGEGLPQGARLWSKAGWTSTVKHDAAIARLAGGREFIAVVFTKGKVAAPSKEILPFIGKRLAAALESGNARF
jgi:beta-lactamase class A